MAIRIFAMPFDPVQEVFQDEELQKFLLNKAVRNLQVQFFSQNGRT